MRMSAYVSAFRCRSLRARPHFQGGIGQLRLQENPNKQRPLEQRLPMNAACFPTHTKPSDLRFASWLELAVSGFSLRRQAPGKVTCTAFRRCDPTGRCDF